MLGVTEDGGLGVNGPADETVGGCDPDGDRCCTNCDELLTAIRWPGTPSLRPTRGNCCNTFCCKFGEI